MFGQIGLLYLIKNYKFKTILDIGSGQGTHANILRACKKKVTEIDLGKSYYSTKRIKNNFIHKDYLNIKFNKKFDAIWACHVLEHQPNPNLFLKKIHKDLKNNGILVITVPPLKDYIVGGHLSLWNAGLLLYNLILAGFDCKNASIKKYDYNITVIVQKKSIKLPKLSYDYKDVEKLIDYFPTKLRNMSNKINNGLLLEGFNGNIKQLNWKE